MCYVCSWREVAKPEEHDICYEQGAGIYDLGFEGQWNENVR
jgi:hypothetical protein